MPHLNLSVDEVLSTTRAVRRRLDLTRSVERELIDECIRLAQQAPNGGNEQVMHFVAVTEPAEKRALAEVYRAGYRDLFRPFVTGDNASDNRFRSQMGASVAYLYDHLHEVPVLLIPCRELSGPRSELTPFRWANHYGDAHMATWSFMLAARERGLATCLTTAHLLYEQQAAELLGIDYERMAQTSLIPVAHALGTDFHPVARKPVDEILHWERW